MGDLGWSPVMLRFLNEAISWAASQLKIEQLVSTFPRLMVVISGLIEHNLISTHYLKKMSPLVFIINYKGRTLLLYKHATLA
jgi:hypothetical protein